MTTSLNVRFARVTDAFAVQAVLRAVREEIPITADVDAGWFVEDIRSECQHRLYWIVDVDNDVAGVMRLVGCELFYLAVAPAHRRKGVARALIGKAKKRCGALYCKTRDDNLVTIALLEAEGFGRETILIAADGWNAYSWARTRYMAEKYGLGQ